MAGFSMILHPTDLSDDAMAAFRTACRIAREGTRIVVLHVLVDTVVYREGYLETLNRRLREWNAADPGVTVQIHLTEGHAVDEILRAAADLACDLIVIGSRGRTGLCERLMGGVTEAVLRRATCPVVVVKSPMPDAAVPEGTSRGSKQRHVLVY
jgi:nucleotide-binding universal stress UspA family protein